MIEKIKNSRLPQIIRSRDSGIIMIKKLEINLFPESSSEANYKKARAEYIAKAKTYRGGGLFSGSYYVSDPAKGEAEWNSCYPEGYRDWANQRQKLTSRGEQNVIDKINEIIEKLNEQELNIGGDNK